MGAGPPAPLVVAALAIAFLGGCHRVWRAQAVQPPPLLGATLEARTSLQATITTGDMELPRWIKLESSAYFVVVSKDRLRFHVSLRHKASDLSDPKRWRVVVRDSLGRRFLPQAIDRRVIRPITSMYERGRGWAVNDLPLYAVTYYRGEGDYTFYRTNLYRHDVRWIELTLQRPGYEYRYRWTFVIDPDSPNAPIVAERRPAAVERAPAAVERAPAPAVPTVMAGLAAAAR